MANKIIESAQREIELARTGKDTYGPLEERSFSSEEFLDLLAYAELLQRHDDRKLLRKKQSAHLEELGVALPDSIPLLDIYEIAKTTQIPRKYLEGALNTRFTSKERQLEDLKNIRARPSMELMADTYAKYLISSLKTTFPFDDFSSSHHGDEQYQDGYVRLDKHYKIKVEKVENFFQRLFKSEKSEIKYDHSDQVDIIVEINFIRPFISGGRLCKAHFYSPLFLIGAGETFEKLNKYFKVKLDDVVYHYPVELDGQSKLK